MKAELQQKLFADAPLLFRQVATVPKWKVEAPDDLFPFLAELVASIEKFNRRYSCRRVRVLKIRVEEGILECAFQRHIPCIEKLVATTRQKIRIHRRKLREDFESRAKKMQSTALFASRLLPEWKIFLPDERQTLIKILKYAERVAMADDDWQSLAHWYRQYLRDDENAQRCENNITPKGEAKKRPIASELRGKETLDQGGLFRPLEDLAVAQDDQTLNFALR